MILKFGARCRCRSEMVGALHAVIVEPAEKLVLQIVVEQPQATPLVRVRVPFGRIEAADADHVALGMSAADFRLLPQHGAETSRTPRRPARGPARSLETEERTLTARTRVECRDGEVGTLGALTLDPRSGDLLGFGFAFGIQITRDIAVGVEHVGEIRDDRLVLRFDMGDLEEFPTLRS